MQSMRHQLNKVKPFSPFWKGDGHITDDTLMTRVLVRAYATKRDHLDAYDVERLIVPAIVDEATWIPELDREDLLYHRLFLAEKWLVLKLRYGHADPRDAGVGNIVNCGAAMYIAPVGIANAGDPDGAYAEAIDLTGAHQSSYGREAAGVLAAARRRGVRARTRPSTRSSRSALRLAKDGDARRRSRRSSTRRRSSTAGARRRPRRAARGVRAVRLGRRELRRAGPERAHPQPAARDRGAADRARAARRDGRRLRARRCSAASTTAATRTRSPRWAARSRARSAAPSGCAATGSRRSRPRAGSTSRRRAATMAAVAVEIFARDAARHEARARAMSALTAGEVPAS